MNISKSFTDFPVAPDITKILLDLISDDLNSEQKQKARDGLRYYSGDHDIKNKIRAYYDKHKKRQVDDTKENNKPVNNFHGDFVDEKVFYILGQAPSYTSTDPELASDLGKALDLSFFETLQDSVEGASNKGSEFLYCYVEDGFFKVAVMPFEELIIIRDRTISERITDIIRYYEIELIDGAETVKRYRVEWYKPEGVSFYQQNKDGEFYPDETELQNPRPYLIKSNLIDGKKIPFESSLWGDPPRLPFVEIRNNRRRTTDLERIRSLQDIYNSIEAGFFDNISDVQEVLLSVSGATAEDPAQLSDNLRYYKLAQFDDEKGKIEAVKVEIPVEAREAALKRLHRDIHHFGKAVLFDPEKYPQSPSGVALKFLYSRLDAKADDVITSLKSALETIVELFRYFQKWKDGREYQKDAFVEWSFNKSQIFNELEKIDGAQKSKDIVSDETILAHHPFVTDVSDELTKLEKQNEGMINLDE